MNFIKPVALMLLCGSANAGWFGPSDYPECVKKYVKQAKSESSVYILRYTCDLQFNMKADSKEWRKYYSCVRDGLEGTEQNVAASAINNACKMQHKELFFKDAYGVYRPNILNFDHLDR